MRLSVPHREFKHENSPVASKMSGSNETDKNVRVNLNNRFVPPRSSDFENFRKSFSAYHQRVRGLRHARESLSAGDNNYQLSGTHEFLEDQSTDRSTKREMRFRFAKIDENFKSLATSTEQRLARMNNSHRKFTDELNTLNSNFGITQNAHREIESQISNMRTEINALASHCDSIGRHVGLNLRSVMSALLR